MVTQETEQGGGAASVRAAARQLDRDRYLAALLAPRRARDGLMALAAFHGEIARIPLTVRESAIGDIRLQWWRDALLTPAGTATGNPIADAMRATMREHALPSEMLIKIIDAYADMLEAGTTDDHSRNRGTYRGDARHRVPRRRANLGKHRRRARRVFARRRRPMLWTRAIAARVAAVGEQGAQPIR